MQAQVPRSFAVNSLLRGTGMGPAISRLVPAATGDALKRRFYRPRHSMTMAPADRTWLIDYYREDVGILAGILNRDLSHWVTP